MPAILSTTLKNAKINAVRTALINGTIEIQAADDTVLAVFDIDATNGGTVTNGVWDIALDATSVNAVAGAPTNATKARFKDSSGTVQITGLTVGTSGADINLASVAVTSGQPVELTEATYSHAADPS